MELKQYEIKDTNVLLNPFLASPEDALNLKNIYFEHFKDKNLENQSWLVWDEISLNEEVDINLLRLKMMEKGFIEFALLDELIEYNLDEGNRPHRLINVHDLINLLKGIIT